MALLNVLKHMDFKPFIPYRFNCEIWPHNDKEHTSTSKLTFTVKKVTQPVIKLGSENKMNYGNTSFVIPILKFGETMLNITFEETDDLSVLNFLSACHSANPYNNADSLLIDIHIQQFNIHMNTTVDDKYYVVKLKSYNMPNYNNTSYGQPVTIDAEFYVLYVYDNMESINEINSTGISIQRNLTDYETENVAIETAKGNIAEWERTHNTDNTNRAALIRAISLKTRDVSKAAAEKNREFTIDTQQKIKPFLRDAIKQHKLYDNDSLLTAIDSAKKKATNMGDISTEQNLKELRKKVEFKEKLSDTETDYLIKTAMGVDFSDGLSNEEVSIISEELSYLSVQENYAQRENAENMFDVFNKKAEDTPSTDQIDAVNAHELEYSNMSTEDLHELANKLGVTEEDITNASKELTDLWAKNNIMPNNTFTSNEQNWYSDDKYSSFKYMSDTDFRKLSSNGWCSAYTSTEISKYLNLDTRLKGTGSGKDYVSTNMVSQINSTGRATAEIIDVDVKSVSDINNLRNLHPDEDTMYLVSTDFVNLSDKNKEKFKQRTIDNGHVVAITSSGVSQGQKNVNPYRNLTDDMIKNGEVQIRVMKIKRKPGNYNSNMGNNSNIDNELEVI